MKSFKVSIILPVYNVEKYLSACLDSLLAQTLEEIEIVAVNDGSTDGSLQILQAYQSLNPEKLFIFSTENHGVSRARNYGFAHSHGEYVWFVDSDDFVEPDACRLLYEKATADGNDLVLFRYYNVDSETGVRKEYIASCHNQNFRVADKPYELPAISPYPWIKFIHRDLFNGLCFPEGIRFEVPFSIRSHGEAITFTIEKGSDGEVSVRSQSSSVQFVDYGKNRKNIQKLRETMEEIKASLTPEELAQRAKDFEEEFNRPLTEEEKAYIEEEKKRNSFLSFFIPRKGFIATPILIDINILVFIVMIASGVGIMSPSTLSLLKWGADFGPLTLTGDWWRTVTCNFIHIGAFHLLMNMYAFMYVGLLLEELIGGRRMFVSYLLTGLCSAAFSLYMHGETISAGASGSIFGLYGIFLAFLLFHRIAKEQRKALLTSILIFVGYNLVYGMKAGIDNAAHIGGLLSGFVLGIIYVVGYKFEKPDAQRTVSIIGELGIFCIFLFSFMILCKNVPPLYPEIRNEWESGIVEAYLNGELEEENENSNHSAVNATDNLSSRKVPAYTPVSNDDTWLSYYDAATKFSCQYPTNWIKIAGAKGIIDGAEPPLLMLVNGGNQLTITALTYDTQKEFEHMKELSLTLPRNAQGEPSEDYQLSNVNINGLPMTKITNPLHIGAPDEPGEDVKQIALHYFQESKKRSFAIVMLVYDEEAETDLNAITSSIQITQ